MNPSSGSTMAIFNCSHNHSSGHARACAPSSLLRAAPARRNRPARPLGATVWSQLATVSTTCGGFTVAQTAP